MATTAARKGLLTVCIVLAAWGLLVWNPTEGRPPLCTNFSGAANDSGYPCRIDHSDGSTEYLYVDDAGTVQHQTQWPALFFGHAIPVAVPIAASVIGLLGIGVLYLTRRRRASPG